MTIWLIFIILAYFIGSIPVGVLLARSRGIDIREHGSKNVGATNVGRVLGKKLGYVCFVLDVAKGALPVIAAGLAAGVFGRSVVEMSALDMWLWLTVGLAAVLGHMCSIFLRFTGGKGVATGFGALAAMWPLLTIPTFAALIVWYATMRISRYVSLASVLAALSLPVTTLLLLMPQAPPEPDEANGPAVDAVVHAVPLLIVTAALAGLVVFKHRGNLRRIQRGEEPKVGEPAPGDANAESNGESAGSSTPDSTGR